MSTKRKSWEFCCCIVQHPSIERPYLLPPLREVANILFPHPGGSHPDALFNTTVVSDIKMEQLLDHKHLHMLGGFDPINRGLHFLHPTSHKLCTVLFQKQQMLFHTSDILMGVLDFVDEMFGCCQLYFYSCICGKHLWSCFIFINAISLHLPS